MKYNLLSIGLVFFTFSAWTQAPYTLKQWPVRVEKNLVYGVATNFFGQNDTLDLDLYKPLGDDNRDRPVLVLVHGGSWIAGCKDDWQSGVVVLASEMAQRGYVVASINYRLGWHRTANDVGILNPYKCAYPADSCEIIRALYRGMQDTKGAIRWLKSRSLIDSTCSRSIIVAGESAGGYNAIAAAFLDRVEEKPACAGQLNAAPTPFFALADCQSYQCQSYSASPSGSQLLRPDLGSIDGDLNLASGIDANVIGAGNFYGGVLDIALSQNWVQGPDTPHIYLHHQTCDGVVPFGTGRLYETISGYCNLGATPWHWYMPISHGSGAISSYLKNIDPNLSVYEDFVSCPPFIPELALFECLRYADNGSYHFLAQPSVRAAEFAGFFSPVITAAQASSPCLVGTNTAQNDFGIKIWPNPSIDFLNVAASPLMDGDTQHLYIFDGTGKIKEKLPLSKDGATTTFDISGYSPGIYFLRRGATVSKFVVVR